MAASRPPVPPRRRYRSFTLLDVMILVAATAVGLALARTILGDAFSVPRSPMWVSRPVTYFLLAWTLAFIPLRLWRPRPSLHRAMIQPGMAACCAVAIVVAIDAFSWITYSVQNEYILRRFTVLQVGYAHNSFESIWSDLGTDTSLAITALWVILALGGRWKSAPIPADRFGRLLGVGWIGCAVLGSLLRYVPLARV